MLVLDENPTERPGHKIVNDGLCDKNRGFLNLLEQHVFGKPSSLLRVLLIPSCSLQTFGHFTTSSLSSYICFPVCFLGVVHVAVFYHLVLEH